MTLENWGLVLNGTSHMSVPCAYATHEERAHVRIGHPTTSSEANAHVGVHSVRTTHRVVPHERGPACAQHAVLGRTALIKFARETSSQANRTSREENEMQ